MQTLILICAQFHPRQHFREMRFFPAAFNIQYYYRDNYILNENSGARVNASSSEQYKALFYFITGKIVTVGEISSDKESVEENY